MDAPIEAVRLRAAMETLSEPHREVLLLAGESWRARPRQRKLSISALQRSG
jgi:hypothetical protein